MTDPNITFRFFLNGSINVINSAAVQFTLQPAFVMVLIGDDDFVRFIQQCLYTTFLMAVILLILYTVRGLEVN